ncbi:hypothetical protein LCGC14_1443370, partial [marine sediment metagenome]
TLNVFSFSGFHRISPKCVNTFQDKTRFITEKPRLYGAFLYGLFSEDTQELSMNIVIKQ